MAIQWVLAGETGESEADEEELSPQDCAGAAAGAGLMLWSASWEALLRELLPLLTVASLVAFIFVFLRGLVKALDFRSRIADVFVLQDGLRPGELRILVEVAAVENHEVDVFADVALGSDAVGGGALRPVLDGLAEFGLTEGLTLLGKEFVQMLDHAVFEGFLTERTEDGNLLFAKGEHGRSIAEDGASAAGSVS